VRRRHTISPVSASTRTPSGRYVSSSAAGCSPDLLQARRVKPLETFVPQHSAAQRLNDPRCPLGASRVWLCCAVRHNSAKRAAWLDASSACADTCCRHKSKMHNGKRNDDRHLSGSVPSGRMTSSSTSTTSSYSTSGTSIFRSKIAGRACVCVSMKRLPLGWGTVLKIRKIRATPPSSHLWRRRSKPC